MKVVHITTGLGTGGSEVMLYKLLSAQNRDKIDSTVISLIDRGTLGSNIATLGIPVYTLGMKRGQATLGDVSRLAKIMRSLNPDIIQGWMYHGNLAALLATSFLGFKVPVLWNIRASQTVLKNQKLSTAATIWLGGKLSHFSAKIINNSHASAIAHQSLGYLFSKTIVIPNGFDTDAMCN
jgi:glycosyltransferase involved in cell wall biosynthesis